MNTKKLLSGLKVVSLAAIFAVGVSYISAQTTFVGPPGNPTTCPTGYPGCDAPLNVGSNTQTKLGALTVNGSTQATFPIGLTVWGQTVLNSGVVGSALQIVDGNQGAGKVLTSDANGNATWGNGSGGIPNNITAFSTPGSSSWVSPAGVTRVLVQAWGGGGSGANSGGGGGAGGYAESVVPVTPGNTYTITVGAGGTSVTGSNVVGNAGGYSSFGIGGTASVYAAKGIGGQLDSNTYASGAGGTGGGYMGTDPNVGTITMIGGQGWSGDNNIVLAGGGSSPQGGSGGGGGGHPSCPTTCVSNYSTTFAPNRAENGVFPGGGGSGLFYNASTYYTGNGANGEVILEY